MDHELEIEPNHEESLGVEETVVAVTIAFLVILFATSLSYVLGKKFANQRFCLFNPPHSIVWLMVGIGLQALGQVKSSTPFLNGIRIVGEMPADIIYLVLLPILLYDSAVNCNWHKFRKMLGSSVLLAYPGVLFSIFMLSIFFKLTFLGPGLPTWNSSFVLSSALASTDPVAVISVLKALNTPEKLRTIFEGESLLNDGTSVAFFQFFTLLGSGADLGVIEIIWKLVRLLFIGSIFGYFWSYVVCYIMSMLHGTGLFSVVFLLMNCYLAFFVGEHHLGLSGPAVAVAFGLNVSAGGIDKLCHAVRHAHHEVVSTLAGIAEAAIFTVAGSIAMRFVLMFNAETVIDSVVNGSLAYLYMNVVRLALIFMAFFYIRRTIYGFHWKEALVLTFGGLRGAIVLALAVLVEENHDNYYSEEFVQLATGVISISVLLNIVINGTSFEFVFQGLNIYPRRVVRRAYLTKLMKNIDDVFEKEYESMKLKHAWFTKIDPDLLGICKNAVPRFKKLKITRAGELQNDGGTLPGLGQLLVDATLNVQKNPETPDIFGVTEGSTGREKDGSGSIELADFPELSQQPRELGLSLDITQLLNEAEQQPSHSNTIESVAIFGEAEGEHLSFGELRVQRECDIHLMICNTLRKIYKGYLDKSLMSHTTFHHLDESVNFMEDYSQFSEDDAIAYKIWQGVVEKKSTFGLAQHREWIYNSLKDGTSKRTAFELGWHVCIKNLFINSRIGMFISSVSKYLPNRILYQLVLRFFRSDVETVLYFVEGLSEFLDQGGKNINELLKGHLLDSMKEQIRHGKDVLRSLHKSYPAVVKLCLYRHLCVSLILKKRHLVRTFVDRGLLLNEDAELLQRICRRQVNRITHH